MKLSTKGKYGLRAVIELALCEEGEAVSIASISAKQHISESYLEQLLAKLRKAGLVSSVRGAGGGYKLAKAATDISVGDILRALEGNVDPVECPGLKGEKECHSDGACMAKYVWQRINESVNDTIDSIKLSEVIKGTEV